MSDAPDPQPEPHRADEAPEVRPVAPEGGAAEPVDADTGTADDAVEPEETVTPGEVRVRRSPRYFSFMIAGAVVFAVVALILTFAFPANPTYDRGSVFGFLLAICAAVGVAVGAVIALILDRTTARRARSVQADRIDVRLPEPATPPARRDGSQPEPGTRTES